MTYIVSVCNSREGKIQLGTCPLLFVFLFFSAFFSFSSLKQTLLKILTKKEIFNQGLQRNDNNYFHLLQFCLISMERVKMKQTVFFLVEEVNFFAF
jgi:hypothetical protein